jgi:hypothetical protein
VWLDVDELQDISKLEESVAESVVFILYYSKGYLELPSKIQNAFLQVPSSEKHYIICGEEFGLENVGKWAIIMQALYGGKSAGADYGCHVRKFMETLNFQSCKADPDVWFWPAQKDDYQLITLLEALLFCHCSHHSHLFLKTQTCTLNLLDGKLSLLNYMLPCILLWHYLTLLELVT